MKIIFFLIFFFQISVFCQEKRLALVIGNSDYEKAVLNNPVNDALLMRETLEKLNFEVILDTNLRTRNDLLNSINLFGEKRKNYSIGLVYYAGHGVQINGENYLLATNEKYESKINVEDNGVNVGRLLDFFELAKNEINILILDACRNNPFEKNWISKSRSMDDGLGLAPLSSSGNIIAFSTSAGRTATDGTENSKNSPYCLSLVRNMMTPDFDLDQIFRNVRKEVREVSGGNQLPTVDNHYEGSDFYFIKSTYIDQINQIDSLIDINDYDLALEKVTFILIKSPNNKQGLLRRGRIEYMKKNKDYDGFHLYKADSLYPKDSQVLEYLGRYYATIGDIEKAIESIDLAMKIDNANPQLFYWKARFYEEKNEIEKAEIEYTQSIMLESSVNRFVDRADFFYRFNKYILAISDYTKAIELDKENPQWYGQRANCYIAIEDYTSSLKDLDKAIDLAPKDAFYFNNRADFYREYKQEDDLALKDYATAIKLSSDSYQTTRVLNNSALIFEKREQYDLAIEQYTKAIELTPMDALLYSNRADVYKNQKKYELALADYTKSIELDKENPQWFEQRANCYLATEDYTSSLKDLDKAIDLAPKDAFYYNNRADFYREYKQEDDLALKDYETAIKLSSDSYESTRALNNRAIIFEKQEQYDLAIVDYTVAIELTPMESLYYSNRANVYKNQKKYELALADYTKAIELDKENPKLYEQRANCYVAMEDYTSSLKDLDKAIDLAPNEPYYFNNRADFYWEYKKDNDSALKDYATAIKLSSDSDQTTTALNNRALIFQEQKQYDLAIVEYTAAIELDPMDALLYSNRANVYKYQKKYALAQADYTHAINLDKKNPEKYLNRAEFYNDCLNKPYDALVDYSLAIVLDSESIYNWFSRGLHFSNHLNDHQSAIYDFKNILKLDSNNATVLNWIGVFYGRLLDDKNEVFYYLKTISKEGVKFDDSLDMQKNGFSYAYQNLAEIYQTSEQEKALDFYNKAIKYDSDNPEKYYHRAWFFALYLQKNNEAIKDLDKSINLDKTNPQWYLNRAKIHLLANKIDNAKYDFDEAVKMSNNTPTHVAERANYYSIIGENKKADKDFDLAMVNDSIIPLVFHLKTEHLIRQKKLNDAMENALNSIKKFVNDTVSYEQIARIYFEKKEYLKALKAYQTIVAIMDFNKAYRTIEPGVRQVYLSDIHIKIADIYEILKDKILRCNSLEEALINLKYETRPDRQTIIKLIEEEIKYCQN